jgi:hypothetical protein
LVELTRVGGRRDDVDKQWRKQDPGENLLQPPVSEEEGCLSYYDCRAKISNKDAP